MADAPIPPLWFKWTGEELIPLRPTMTDRHLVVGESYCFVEHHERSTATHNHEFAAIADLWKSLPERYSHEPWAQSAEHLRKFALVRTGFCNTQTYVCGSRAEAERWAQNLRPLDEYSVVSVEGSTVFRYHGRIPVSTQHGRQEVSGEQNRNSPIPGRSDRRRSRLIERREGSMSARLATRACRYQERRMRALLAFELASSGDTQASIGTPSPGEAASYAPDTPARSDGAATLFGARESGPEAVAGQPKPPRALAGDRLNFQTRRT